MNKFRKLCGLAMICGLFVAASPAAHAIAEVPSVTTAAPDVVAPPGGVAFPQLTFSMAGGYSIIDLTLNIDYDASKLSFDRALSTVTYTAIGGGTTNMSLTSFEASTGFAPVNHDSLAGLYTLAGSLAAPITASSLVIKGHFNVLSPTAPDSSSIWIRGTVTDVAALAGDDFDHTVNVSIVAAPVPEPESWAMLLAGLGIIGATARRRRASRAA